jgi:hypothetical protein
VKTALDPAQLEENIVKKYSILYCNVSLYTGVDIAYEALNWLDEIANE